jgi:hypothetical protein
VHRAEGPAIGFLRVPEPKTAKNRLRLDIRAVGKAPWDMAEREQLIRAKVSELADAGATAVPEESYGAELGHVVMHDPEGNEFCVALTASPDRVARPETLRRLRFLCVA